VIFPQASQIGCLHGPPSVATGQPVGYDQAIVKILRADNLRSAVDRWLHCVAVGGAFFFCSAPVHAQQQLYNHGDPTPYEQYMLEMVNTARADPSAEGVRLGVGLNDDLAPGIITTNTKTPLAFHPKLIAAARAHSDWMLTTGTFSHTGVGGSSPTQRAASQGYTFSVAENIGYRSTNVAVSPAVLASMTRGVHDALFRSAGHRRNILTGSYAVVGLGVRSGLFGGFNAAMTTQNFSDGGDTIDSGPFITGVAFEDRNGNSTYDPGEGLANVEVRPSTGNYYAVTSSSGGYAIPIAAVQTNAETVNLPFPVGSRTWADVLPYDENFRRQKFESAASMTMNLTWSGGGLPAPVTTALTLTRPVRLNFRLQGTDGFFYDRTMVTTRSVRANLDIAAPPALSPTPVPAAQTVTFSPLAPVVFSPTRVVRPSGRASSRLPVTFTSSDPAVAEISEGKILVRGAGTATITARQAGNASFLAAETSRDLVVRKARQTIIFPAPVRPPFSAGATFTLSARATSGEPATYSAQPDGIVSITGQTATMIAPGRLKIIATQGGTPNHETASVPKTIVIR